MSAIAALWNFASCKPAGRAVEHMLDALHEYGPDHRSVWSEQEVSLGRNLMALVPEDRFDEQPERNHSTFVLVAEVRLDNREDLARALKLGSIAQRSDASILAAAWDHWQQDCLKHLLGAFAFAVWTPHRKELFAARDHAGEYPLFFHRGEDFFALASMPKALRTLDGVGSDFNPAWIANWLVVAPSEPRASIFEGIERLPKASFLRVTPTSFECRSYWNPADTPPIRFKRNQDYADGLRDVLDRATTPLLRSIGGIGSQLSSGLDSSSVTAAAALQLAHTGKHLTAYTSVPQPGFSTDSYSSRPVLDEGPFAAQVAALYPNITHVQLAVPGQRLLENTQTLNRLLDAPFLNVINGLWITSILRDARERHLGAVLQGNFGNATLTFEGSASLGELLRRGRWHVLVRHMRTMRANQEMSYTNAARKALEGVTPRWQLRRGPIVNNRGSSPINPEFAARQQLGRKIREMISPVAERYRSFRQGFFHFADYGSLNAALRAYAHVDVRDPTGDKRVWEYCYGIPFEQNVIDGHTRSLVRRAMRGRLPDSTLDRYRQGRQGADWYMNMRLSLPQLHQELEQIEQSPAAQRMLDLPHMRHLLENFPTEGYGTIHVMNTWKYGLLRGISLGSFLRLHDPALTQPSTSPGSSAVFSPTASP